MSDPPFFILGAQGSGSTLLRLMLDSHENIAVPPETGVMRLVTAHRWVPFWELGGDWHDRLGLTADDVDRRLAEFYGRMFSDYAESQGKRRWGEKTPFHVWHVDEIRSLFPDASFVVIVRHPLGSIASAVRRFDRRLPKATAHWLGTTREVVRQAAVVGDRMCLVRYEDLIREPTAVMGELLDRLGEPWSDAVVSHHEVQRARRTPASVEGGTRPADAVDTGRVDRWRKWFADEDRRLVWEQTRGWAALFGYGAEPAAVPERLTPESAGRRYVVTGPELSERRSEFVDLDPTPPSRPVSDDPILPRGRRRRRKALRRAASGRPDVARQLFARLPPSLQRSVRESRRERRRRRRS